MSNAEYPWFPFYARDWKTDIHVRMMTLECRGAYLELLCDQWENGRIPEVPAMIACLLGYSGIDAGVHFQAEIWSRLEGQFPVSSDGWRRNQRMEDIRHDQESRAARLSSAGRTGGKASAVNRVPARTKNDRSTTVQRPFKHPDADADEDPLTPTRGGSEIPAGESGARNEGTTPRALGTNPRALVTAEEAHARKAEEVRRALLMRKLDPDQTIGGTYFGDRGFRLWTDLSTEELRQCARMTEVSAPPADMPSELAKLAAAARETREAKRLEKAKKRDGGLESETQQRETSDTAGGDGK